MKKLITICITFLIIAVTSGSSPVNNNTTKNKIYASEIFIPIGKTGNKISLLELSTITKADLEKITGNKMNSAESRAFYGAQKKLKKGINSDGVVTKSKLKKLYNEGKEGIDGTTGFHLGGFALGFFLTIIGVLIAYLLKDGKSKNRQKWAWIGLAAAIVFGLAFFL